MPNLNPAIRAWEGRYCNPLSANEVRVMARNPWGTDLLTTGVGFGAGYAVADRMHLRKSKNPVTGRSFKQTLLEMAGEQFYKPSVRVEPASTENDYFVTIRDGMGGVVYQTSGASGDILYRFGKWLQRGSVRNPASVKDQLGELIAVASDRAELARNRGDKGLANWYLGQAYAYQNLRNTQLLKRKSRKGGMPFLRKRNPGFVLNQLAKIRSTNEEVVIRAVDERKGLLTTANFYTVQRKDGSQVVLDDGQIAMLNPVDRNPSIPNMTKIEQEWLEQWLANQIHDSQRGVELFAAEARGATGEKRQLLIDQKNFSDGQVAAYKQMAKRVGMKQRNPVFASLLSGVGLGAGVALGQKAVGWGMNKVSAEKQNVVQNPTWHEESASKAKIAGRIRSRDMAEGGKCSNCKKRVGPGELARYEMQSGGMQWDAMKGQFCSDECMGRYHR